MSTPATSVHYEYNNSELLQGGLVIKGTFPDGATSVTVPMDYLADDDLIIPVTKTSVALGSKIQELTASRVVGGAGVITLVNVNGAAIAGDRKFELLVIRKGIGRHLNPGTPNPKLLYNHSTGMNVFQVTTAVGITQTVSVPGIFLNKADRIVVVKTNAVSQSDIIEIKASRLAYPTESFVLGTAGGEALVAGDIVIVFIFAGQSYDQFINASTIQKTSFKPIQGPFGPLDITCDSTIVVGVTDAVISEVPYLTSDTVVIPIQTSQDGNAVYGICEDLAERVAGVAPATNNFEIALCDSNQTAGSNITFEVLIIQTQGRKL
jgi:hypothetical protein